MIEITGSSRTGKVKMLLEMLGLEVKDFDSKIIILEDLGAVLDGK